MLGIIRARISIELAHYRALTVDARRLLLSYYLFLIAYPLFDLFINAFIWRQDNDLKQMVYYNIAVCLGIPLSFYLNGLLLRRFHVVRLYTVGLFLQTASAMLVVFSTNSSNLMLWLFGIIAGFGAGFFWANKNYLSLILSRGSNRLYYNSLENTVLLFIKISVPLFAGSFIALGSSLSLYTATTAYRLIMCLGLLAMIISSLIINKSTIPDVKSEPLFLTRPSRRWSYVRLYSFMYNVVAGAEFVIPTVLVLTLLGKEGVLGLVTSGAAALSALSLYTLGRKGNLSHIWKTVATGNLIYAISTIFLAFIFGPWAVLFYMAGFTISKALRFAPPYTVTMEIMDQEGEHGQYAYLCDNELSYNAGRVSGLILVFVLALTNPNTDLVLRYLPILLGVIVVGSLLPLGKMVNSLKN